MLTPLSAWLGRPETLRGRSDQDLLRLRACKRLLEGLIWPVDELTRPQTFRRQSWGALAYERVSSSISPPASNAIPRYVSVVSTLSPSRKPAWTVGSRVSSEPVVSWSPAPIRPASPRDNAAISRTARDSAASPHERLEVRL
jgi:hypothetical protein